jgi:hypothetical protein
VFGGEGGGASEWFGYLSMLVALSMIFIGIKRYRDRQLGGVIRFGSALGLGVAIAAVAGVAYVAAWELYLAATDYAFAREYAAGLIEARRQAGVSGDALQAEIDALEAFQARYANPWYRLPITFSEIFPVGAIIALISAALLRNPKLLPAARQG